MSSPVKNIIEVINLLGPAERAFVRKMAFHAMHTSPPSRSEQLDYEHISRTLSRAASSEELKKE